ncbi:hypothetical protein IHE45_11G065200 [Dioscorea alata]|uniref:Uncharacterized protein n=1 Tax=Dioscorea alata TaxID=55571 RepID=A0ACB7V6U5_DIOAL|nr:hypothetical protein IHE45_11G065200 [Dioscorea alata]
MESKSIMESLSEAYEALVTATMAVIEAHRECSGHRNEALEEFKRRWELFSAACDEADGVVESAKLRVEFERVCVANEGHDDSIALTSLSLAGLEDVIAHLKRA